MFRFDLYSKVIGSGSYLPEKILTNHDLAKIVETSHDWIFERTGIEQRHIASENESSVDMAYNASLKAMSLAELRPDDIDMIIVIAKLASGSDNTLPTSMSYTIACDNGAGAFATDHSLLSGTAADADELHDADIRTMAGVDITDTTALASGEQFKFSIHTTNCDDVAIVGGSLSLTLNVEGGGDTRLDLEIETVAIGDKLIWECFQKLCLKEIMTMEDKKWAFLITYPSVA